MRIILHKNNVCCAVKFPLLVPHFGFEPNLPAYETRVTSDVVRQNWREMDDLNALVRVWSATVYQVA